MAEANDIRVCGGIYQNLFDAGCETKRADQCMIFLEKGRYSGMLLVFK